MDGNKTPGSNAFLNPDDDAPEMTAEVFDYAEIRHGETIIRPYRGPGRPKLDSPKQQVTVRLDSDVLERLRNTGPGWQSRLNTAVRSWMDLSAAPARD